MIFIKSRYETFEKSRTQPICSTIRTSFAGRRAMLFALLTLVSLTFAGCSTTKHLPEGEILYIGIRKTEIINEDKSSTGQTTLSDVESALACSPDNSFLGSSSKRFPIPFRMWIYNAFINKKGKVNRWVFKTLGGKPVLISSVRPDVRTKVAENLMKENGYFDGTVSYDIEPNPKNPREAKLRYRVAMNSLYRIDTIDWSRVHPSTVSLIENNKHETLLHVGDPFNIDRMQAERQRIAALLRDYGYYYYRPDFILYQADTTAKAEKVALRLVAAGNLPPAVLQSYKLGNISVWLNGYNNESPTDSIRYKDLIIHYEGKLRVRPSVIYNRLYVKKGDLFSLKTQEQTQTALSRLGIFRYAEMQYAPGDSIRRADTLDLKINTVYDLPLDGELEMNVIAKSNNYVGPGVTFGLTKRNIFGGGETFNVKLRGSYEWQTGNRVIGTSAGLNSYEFGMTSTLSVPGLMLPLKHKLDGKYPANTTFGIHIGQMNRARFFSLLTFGGNASFDFQTTPVVRHSFTPFRLAFNLLQSRTAEFDSIMQANPALSKSLENQFIPSIGYTFTYDQSSLDNKRNLLWAQFSITEAGLLTNSLYSLAGNNFGEKDKKLFGNPFAQFIKATAEARYNMDLGGKQHLVARLMVGAAYAYGNSTTVPYNEQFYVGGANSIRAFPIRSIGPGRFRPNPINQYAYIDQTGDLKFEANLEYRFPIWGNIHGATFLDCGNIWLLRDDPLREGGKFSVGDLFQQLALGTGVGIRYVLPFLIARFDVGVGLHVPFDTGKAGYYNIPRFKDGLGFHFAVGYPF